MFRALVLEEAGGVVTSTMRELDDSALPDGNVIVAIEYTTVNYKDGLVINGGGGLVKRWPLYPASISPAVWKRANTRTIGPVTK